MDNFFKNCPPVMSDGRLFTDYKTPTRRNEYIKYSNKIIRDDEYRVFLQQNGSKIMNNVWEYNKQHNSCRANHCVHTYPTRVLPQDLRNELLTHNKANQFLSQSMPLNGKGCEAFEDYKMTDY